METQRTKTARHDTTLARALAPEDVRPGDFVAILDEEYEWPASCWYLDPPVHADLIIRVRMRHRDIDPPLKVIDACLPFVFVKPPKGAGRTIDLRAVRLARLDRDYARRVWKSLGPAAKPAKRKGRKANK